MLSSGKTPKTKLPDKRPLFYCITDRAQLSGKPLLPVIRRAILWGVDFVQIREKDLSDRKLFELAQQVVALTQKGTCKVLINGRADIALAAGAHGVHLPTRGLLASDLKSWVAEDFLVGTSVHSMREARQAAEHGADYLLLGPVFATASKMRYGPPLGLSYLRRVCRKIPIPVLALGGMRLDLVPQVVRAGACGIAGITMFQKFGGRKL